MNGSARKPRWWQKVPLFGTLLAAALLVAALLYVDDARDATLALLHWMDSLGSKGALIFFGIYVFVVVLLLPGVVLTLGAGLVYGFWVGSLLVLASLAVGSSIAFIIARHCFSEGFSRRIESRPSLQVLNRGIEQEGWKLVALSRCMPGFPYKLSNYFFGLTALPFRHFFFANLVGVIPLTLTNVYIGSVTANLAQLGERERQPWEWMLYAVGLVVAVVILWILTRMAQRALRQVELNEDPS